MSNETLHIIMFSGGLDSTYLLWKFLSEGKKVHAHHVSIRNLAEPDLWKMQLIATGKIVAELKKDFDFEFTQSKHEWYCAKSVSYDTDIVLVHAQNLCMALCNSPLKLYLGWVPDDLKSLQVQLRWENKVTAKLWAALRECIMFPKNNIPLGIETPLVDNNITKQFICKNLPDEVLKLTWSCRKPFEYKPCKSCFSCIVRGGK